MPVITSTITDESGSSRNASGTCSGPEAIQENTTSSMARTPAFGSMPRTRITATTGTPNAAAMAPVATRTETAFGERRPIVALNRNPTSGRSGIRYSTRSPLQRREHVRTERLLVPEQCDDDRKADGGFGRGHGHDEEHDDLPVD